MTSSNSREACHCLNGIWIQNICFVKNCLKFFETQFGILDPIRHSDILSTVSVTSHVTKNAQNVGIWMNSDFESLLNLFGFTVGSEIQPFEIRNHSNSGRKRCITLLWFFFFLPYSSLSPCKGRPLFLLFTLLPDSVGLGLRLPGSPET